MKTREITGLVKHIERCRRKYGMKKLTKALTDIDKQGDEYDESILDEIIAVTASRYKVNKNTLIESKNSKNTSISGAQRICFVLMKKHLSMNEKDIASYFERDKKVVYRAIDDFNSMDEKITWHREQLQKYKSIDTHIGEFRRKKNTKQKVKKTA